MPRDALTSIGAAVLIAVVIFAIVHAVATMLQ